jgi:hypothetical protein
MCASWVCGTRTDEKCSCLWGLVLSMGGETLAALDLVPAPPPRGAHVCGCGYGCAAVPQAEMAAEALRAQAHMETERLGLEIARLQDELLAAQTAATGAERCVGMLVFLLAWTPTPPLLLPFVEGTLKG